MNLEKISWICLRLSMSLIFLWAFFDKVFGLGFSTKSSQAWIHGGSPTSGFLSFAAKGPFVEIFRSLSGIAIVDWLFMLGLLFVGLTLLMNRFVVWGSITGIVMLFLMYLALLLPENNPIIDEHIVYIFVLSLFAFKNKRS
jgi:thiosulfate dehydrogenase [quinone] large subunit